MQEHRLVTVDCDILPKFTAAYLRIGQDGECAFIEAHTAHAVPRLLKALAHNGKRPEDVKYVVLTHAHLDHAAGASALLAKCPNATLLAHPRTAKHMIDPSKLVAGAKEVYGEARFTELYGTVDPIPKERVRGLADNEFFDVGRATLRVHHTAGHAWHHMVIDDVEVDTVYTGDAFGLVYPALQRRVRFAIPSTSPTGFDAAEAHKSIDFVVGLEEKAACLTHFGEVHDIANVASQLRWWIDRSQEWVEAAKREGAPSDVAQKQIETKIRAAMATHASKVGLSLDEDDWKLLALDIELNAQGLAYAATKG